MSQVAALHESHICGGRGRRVSLGRGLWHGAAHAHLGHGRGAYAPFDCCAAQVGRAEGTRDQAGTDVLEGPGVVGESQRLEQPVLDQVVWRGSKQVDELAAVVVVYEEEAES